MSLRRFLIFTAEHIALQHVHNIQMVLTGLSPCVDARMAFEASQVRMCRFVRTEAFVQEQAGKLLYPDNF
jgi:hypothetical protein